MTPSHTAVRADKAVRADLVARGITKSFGPVRALTGVDLVLPAGQVTALQNQGVKPANIAGVGLGAYLTCKDWAAGQDTGNKAALYISGYDVGSAAVKAMVADLRDGTELPAETIADTHMVDASNWESEGVVCT